MPLLSFQEALDAVAGQSKPKVLLGNGFSRACRNDIFAYDALFDRADFNNLSVRAREAFRALGTTDFELVMRALRHSAVLAPVYDAEPLAAVMSHDADGLRDVLVRTIAESHPAHPNEITPDRYAACRTFLSHFECYYTVNYDLLLYWALMHDDTPPPLNSDDGFRAPDGDPEAEYVSWDIQKTNHQNVFYLHGALHVFDTGPEVVKYTWSRTQVRLIDQIRDALMRDFYPLFVAEGESQHKAERIRHSDFLSRALRSFANIGKTLFVYGHSFADNDAHILRLIADGKVSQLFVSIYGDEHTPENQTIMRKAAALGADRGPRNLLSVRFYDAESARVWG